MYEKVKATLLKRKSLNENDDIAIKSCWEDLVSILGENEDETIECLNLCTEEEFEWISEVFEDVAYKLQSHDYIKCLRQLNAKYPNLNLDREIDIAESYIY